MYYKGSYCNVGQFDPSSRTIDAIKEMNRITDMANLLDRILTAVPFFQIFAGRSTFAFASVISMGEQVRSSDWDAFAGAVRGVGQIERNQLEIVAMKAGDMSMGEEANFLECVYNAL